MKRINLPAPVINICTFLDLQISMRFAFVIFEFHYPASLRSWYQFNFQTLPHCVCFQSYYTIPIRFAQGTIRLTLQTSLRSFYHGTMRLV